MLDDDMPVPIAFLRNGINGRARALTGIDLGLVGSVPIAARQPSSCSVADRNLNVIGGTIDIRSYFRIVSLECPSKIQFLAQCLRQISFRLFVVWSAVGFFGGWSRVRVSGAPERFSCASNSSRICLAVKSYMPTVRRELI